MSDPNSHIPDAEIEKELMAFMKKQMISTITEAMAIEREACALICERLNLPVAAQAIRRREQE